MDEISMYIFMYVKLILRVKDNCVAISMYEGEVATTNDMRTSFTWYHSSNKTKRILFYLRNVYNFFLQIRIYANDSF